MADSKVTDDIEVKVAQKRSRDTFKQFGNKMYAHIRLTNVDFKFAVLRETNVTEREKKNLSNVAIFLDIFF